MVRVPVPAPGSVGLGLGFRFSSVFRMQCESEFEPQVGLGSGWGRVRVRVRSTHLPRRRRQGASGELGAVRLVVERAAGGGEGRAAERVGHVHTRARREQQLDQLELLRRHGRHEQRSPHAPDEGWAEDSSALGQFTARTRVRARLGLGFGPRSRRVVGQACPSR